MPRISAGPHFFVKHLCKWIIMKQKLALHFLSRGRVGRSTGKQTSDMGTGTLSDPTNNPHGGEAGTSVAHRLIILGGGFGGLYAARALAHAPVELKLIDRRNFHLFQPLLYQVATGSLSP